MERIETHCGLVDFCSCSVLWDSQIPKGVLVTDCEWIISGCHDPLWQIKSKGPDIFSVGIDIRFFR